MRSCRRSSLQNRRCVWTDGQQSRVSALLRAAAITGIGLLSRRQGRGRGLVIQTAENEFYICGVAFWLAFRSNPPLSEWKAPQQDYQLEHFLDYLRVEEGRFDAEGSWICERIRNGDETDFGVYVFPDNGAVRVVLEGI